VSLFRPVGAIPTVGAMLVHPHHQREGIGRSLLAHVESQAAGDETLQLYATAQGEPLYRSAGWVDREVVHVHDRRYGIPVQQPTLSTHRPGPGGTCAEGSGLEDFSASPSICCASVCIN